MKTKEKKSQMVRLSGPQMETPALLAASRHLLQRRWPPFHSEVRPSKTQLTRPEKPAISRAEGMIRRENRSAAERGKEDKAERALSSA
jgi:hypothetical protein